VAIKTLNEEETSNLGKKIISRFRTIFLITKKIVLSLKKSHVQLMNGGDILQNVSLINSGFLEGKSPLFRN
jgi:hypothetical protein